MRARPRPGTGVHELIDDRALDPEVVGDHEQTRVVGADGVGLGCGHLGDEVTPVGATVGLGGREERLAVGNTERARHRACRADVARQPTRIDPREPGDVMTFEKRREVFGRAPTRRPAGKVADDHAAAMGRTRLVVVTVDAVVADVRIGEVMIWPA